MEDIPLQFLFIFILLGFSAFFSGSETAFFSINYIALQKLKKARDSRSKIVCKLLNKPNSLLITILIANMIVNILAAAIASGICIGIAQRLNLNDYIGTLFSIVIMTLVLLFFGEITPKLITVKKPIKFAKLFCYPVLFILVILKPLSFIFQGFTDFLTAKVFKEDNNVFNNQDIESAIKIGHKEGLIDKEEQEMFKNIFDSMGKEVQDIMLPKTKMFTIDIKTSLKKLISEVISCRYKLVPICKNTDDNILGVVRCKDLLPYNFNLQKLTGIKQLLSPVLYVPEGKKIVDLLKEFQQQKKEFSIVVDEYGNRIGFITLDDLIEEIVGEYKDEYDREDVFIRQMGKGRFLIKGDMKIEEFNEVFNENFTSEDANTINGLMLESFEKIPKKGEKIILNKYVFTVSKQKGHIIKTVIVEKLRRKR